MTNNKLIASDAIVKALKIRKRISVPLYESISPLDAAERLGIEVRFMDLPSMEGMYIAGDNPKIVLSSLRPQGRRNFTCAHEIGHHEFGHGEQFDELTNEKSSSRKRDPKEFAADSFAAFFLMPKSTIDNGMSKRGYGYKSLTSIEAYKMACWLGVGYSTFINHLWHSLNLIDQEKSITLLSSQPREIRYEFLGKHTSSELHIVDQHWLGRPIDCQVGDYLLFPDNAVIEREHMFTSHDHVNGKLVRAELTGLARVSINEVEWASFIRISPYQYSGRSCYRFEEEVDE